MSYSPTAPTYVSRLDPQFRRFVNVVYHESPTSSMNDLSEAATESLQSGSFSEKSPEFIAVDAYVDDGSLRVQGQRQVSEFYLEYVNVLSSGSETSFTSDDKEIAKSWRESRSHSSNSEQRYKRDRIPSHFSIEDSVFLSDGCQESLYEENEINYYLRKRSSSKRQSDSNAPTLGSFSSEAGSEGNNRHKNDTERFREHLEGIKTSAPSGCIEEKDNISSVPWFHGQEVIPDGLQITSRRIHDSLDDLFSEDSELRDSSEVVEDGYSSTSSADSSFVRFALVGKRGSKRMKRNVPTRLSQKDYHKRHSNEPSRERRESGGEEGDEGVMACVVSGISGGPAVRVFRNDVSQQSYLRSRRFPQYPRNLEEALTRRGETKSAESENINTEGTRAQNKRSKESDGRIVFGVFGTQANPPDVDQGSGIDCDTKELHPNRENLSLNMENSNDYDGPLPAFDGNKPFIQDYLSQTASQNDGGRENDGYSSREDRMKAFSKSVEVTPSCGAWKRFSTDAGNERVKQKQLENAKKEDQDFLLHSMARSITGGKDERVIASESHISGSSDRPINVSVKAISKTPKVRRPRRKPSEVELQGLQNGKDRTKASKFLSEEMYARYPERQHEMRDGRSKELSGLHTDKFVKVQEPSSTFNSATSSLDLRSDQQDWTESGSLESRTEFSILEAQLKIDKVQGSTPVEYGAVSRKTELLTPVKQTIKESVRTSLLVGSDSDSEWEVCLEKSGRPSPEGHMGVALASDLDNFEHSSAEKRTLSQMSDSNQACLGVSKSREVSSNFSREGIAGKNNELSSSVRHGKNSLITTENWSMDQGFALDAANESEGADLTEYDSLSKNAGDIAAKATRKEKGCPAPSGGTTEESMDTADTWTANDMRYHRYEMNSASSEPGRTPGIGLEPKEETAYVNSPENDMEIAKQPRKRKDFPSFLDSQNETKRKAAEEEKRETGYSRKIKRLSKTYSENDERRPTIKSEFSLKPFSATEKASKRHFHTEKDHGSANSPKEDVNRVTFVRSDHLSASYHVQAISSQASSQESTTAEALPSFISESKDDFGSTQGISREIKEPQGSFTAPSFAEDAKTSELKLGKSGQRRLTEEMPQFSSSNNRRSLIPPSMESITTSEPEVEGKSHGEIQGEIPDISSQSSLIAPLETIASSGPKLESSGQSVLTEKNLEISSSDHQSFLADVTYPDRSSSSEPAIKGDERKRLREVIPQISTGGHPTSLTAPSFEESVTFSKRKLEPSGRTILTAAETPKTFSSSYQSSPTAPSFIDTSSLSEPKLAGKEMSRLTEENPRTSSRDHQSSPTTSSLKESPAPSEPNFGGNEKLVHTDEISKIKTKNPQSYLNVPSKETYASLEPKLGSQILERVLIPENDGENSDEEDPKLTDSSGKENNHVLPGEEVVVWCDIESKAFPTGHSLILNNDNEVRHADEDAEKKPQSLNSLIEPVLKENDSRKVLTLSTVISTSTEISRPEKVVNTPYRYPDDKPRTNSSSDEFGGFDEQAAGSCNPKTDHEDREFCNNDPCIFENVCFVASTDNCGQWEDGAQSVKHNSDQSVERNVVFFEQDIGSSPSEIINTEDSPVCGEEMRGSEVEEISCTHDEDVYSSADQLFEGYRNNATDQTYPGNSHLSSGEVDMKIEGDAQADVTTNIESEKIFKPVETRKIYLVQPADVKSRRSSFGCDRTESPNENESSYDTDANLERKDTFHQRPVADLATFLLSDLEEKSETGQLYEHYTNYSAMQVLDKQCQVELLQENFRKYESRESQTSFLNGATNRECQTNVVSDLPNLRRTLQNQNVECQTELPTICCVGCGGPVQSFDFQDELSMECRYTNRESRTISEDGNISTSTKQCQTSPSGEDLSQLLIHQSSATIIGSKAVREIAFESKGCQTSERSLLLSTSGAEVLQVLRSYHQVGVSDKEIQTSSNVVLVSSPAQCDILPFTYVGDLAARVNETSQLLSFATKECQTVHDLELLLATSKHCQTISFETTSAGNESRPTIVSKGCQTLPAGRTESKGCQTMDEIALNISDVTRSSKGDQSVSHTSVECQTISDSMNELYHPLWDRPETMKVVGDEPRNKSLDPLNRNELTISCENKGSQTKPERDILLTSSKLCQTTTLDTAMACENKESQTQLDDEIFLILSKACQTIPYGLDDTDSKSPIDGPIGSKDFALSLAESSEQQLEISSPSNPMASRHRPATYGKSPDTTEESFMGFQLFHEMDETDLCNSKAVEPLSPVGSSVVVDFSDKGCQAMLCDCGNCAEQHALVSNWTEMSSDLERGAAMRVSEGMQKEQASLIKQLDMLRDMNQKLRDDKDAIEAAHQAMLMAKKERGYGSLSDEIEEAEKKTKVSRQGSQMSKYVRKRRTPGAEDTWGNQGSVGSLSEEEVDGPNKSDSARPPARRRSKRRDMKKQGSVLHSYFPNTGSGSQSSVSLPDSIREEAEFDGDPTLELISDEKLKEDERPAWAQKILSCVQPKELVEEEGEESKMRASDEEIEEEVFRTRKTELISGAANNRIKKGKDDSDMSYSEGLSAETGSETDDRPNSPRAAPVGKDNEMSRVGSQDLSEAGVSAISEPATPERVFKVVFVGDSGVGKSSFIHRFCHDAWRPSFTATIGVDFQIKTMNIDGRCIALQLWDTAGQERFRSITKQYFRKADGVIVFYDITMETSFLNIKNWMISVEEGTDDGTAIMIVGNKIDLVEDDTHRAVQSQEGKKLAEEYKALYTETSAKTGSNIPESMAEFSKMLQVREDELMQSVLNLVEEKPGKKKCCK